MSYFEGNADWSESSMIMEKFNSEMQRLEIQEGMVSRDYAFLEKEWTIYDDMKYQMVQNYVK